MKQAGEVSALVHFTGPISLDQQGVVLLEFERTMRRVTGLDCRVYKDLKGDDSKLRVMMSPEMRAKL